MISYDEYLQLRSMAEQQIESSMAKMMPTGGHGVVISGGIVSLQQDAEPQPAPDPQTWEIYVFGTVRGNINGDLWTYGPALAATIHRPDSFLTRTYFWQDTQLFNIPLDDGEPALFRKIELTLTARAIPPGEEKTATAGWKAPDFVLELIEQEQGAPAPAPILRSFSVPIVGGTSDTRSFSAKTSGITTELNPVSIRRL